MHLAQILFIQGFGTRRQCAGIVAAGRVRIGGQVVDDPHADVATEDLVFEVEGRPWPYRERALLMLHKPAGYECSQKPRHHPSVLSLLPPPLRSGLNSSGACPRPVTKTRHRSPGRTVRWCGKACGCASARRLTDEAPAATRQSGCTCATSRVPRSRRRCW